jgi:aryl-alcohol dehydrogenase-like predicted oxidoreductase
MSPSTLPQRPLGRTGLRVAPLGFGCGDVGGIMVRGTPADRERAAARAIELGINYFDTASSYGQGQSERNLGPVLKALRADVHVGTKVRLNPEDMKDVRGAIARSLDASLGRLGRERVDILYLHNPVARVSAGSRVGAKVVLDDVAAGMEDLKKQGKIRFFGMTALGEVGALHRVLSSGAVEVAQVCFNLLNPTAAYPTPLGFPAQDFDGLLHLTEEVGVGTVGIRIMAAGALSGTVERHPVAIPTVDPIASGPDYATDVTRGRVFEALVRDGHASSVVEAAHRFAITPSGMSVILSGWSEMSHLEAAAAAIAKGPLPPAALERAAACWAELARRG